VGSEKTYYFVPSSMASSRIFKQIAISAGYLLFLGAVLFSVYYLFIRVAPTCSDGKQNQDEMGIDCGGICANQCEPPLNAKDIVTREVAFVPADRGSYDVLARIYNPNDIAGASRFSYKLTLFGMPREGLLLREQSGTSFHPAAGDEVPVSSSIFRDAGKSGQGDYLRFPGSGPGNVSMDIRNVHG
jgi:hypothetical protein